MPGRLRRGPSRGRRGPAQRAGLGPDRCRGRPTARARGVECAGAAGRPAGRDPGCVCDPAASVVDRGGPGAGALAAVTAELVSTGVELANREVEVAQLRQALSNRVWIEQAKGVLAATRGTGPDAAFQQLRATARATNRKLAEVAQEVVQDAQRDRLAARAQRDPRARDAEARAQAAEQALQAAQADLAQ